MRHARRPDGTAVVVKLIRAHSDELSLLRYLGSITSVDNHTIPLLATFNLSVGTFMVIPEATPLDLGCKHGYFQGEVAHLSRQLVNGVAFLHENGVAHLDIKPGNIVVTRQNHVYIIDFDISVLVNGPDELIDQWLGTPPWMAPEIGDQDGPRCLYSPIRADLWSCGLVLRYLALRRGKEEDIFETLARQLLNKKPYFRPMLSLPRLDKKMRLPSPGKATLVLTSRHHELKRTRDAHSHRSL
jgi:serine/threonine protein kinase